MIGSERQGAVLVVSLRRPEVRNAVDRATAQALAEAFAAFDADESLSVAVLSGSSDSFCAGADLKAFASGQSNRLEEDGDGPMGPTRMLLSKPVIAAIEGHCVAGGLELALWCDLRVAAQNATLGFFCRRFGVPLIDGGSVRLPRLIGQSRALDLILTGRAVEAEEALQIGLVNRLCAPGQALSTALQLAQQLAQLPQRCLRSDRLCVYEQAALPLQEALAHEFRRGLRVIESGESLRGAGRFARGEGRHGH